MKEFHLPDLSVNTLEEVSDFPLSISLNFHPTNRTRHRGHKQKRRFDRLIFIILLSLEYLLSV